MSGIPLQSRIIYGPIHSRRLGRSLGINLLPFDQKVCNFDCIYCQYGSTSDSAIVVKQASLPGVEDVITAVEKALKKPRTLDYLTFSGNGEPTIHPNFPEIVAEVKKLKDQLRPELKLGILSNSSNVMQPEIIKALGLMDAPMMKLDVGDEDTFKMINKPIGNINFQDMVSGLKEVPNLMIQTMLLDGDIMNIRGKAYDAWVSALVSLAPVKTHIYSIARPTAKLNLKPVPMEKLISIAEALCSDYGLDVEAF
jgi:wyosine [tRNA(Phe)-imidazoG37] synthetase (radical SAM superfamily)